MKQSNKENRREWNSKYRAVVEFDEWLHKNFDKLSKEEIMNEIVSFMKKNNYDVSKAEAIYEYERIFLKNRDKLTD